MHSLNDKTIVLTGAGGGIGRAIAKALSEQGATLVLCDRNAQALGAVKHELGSHHHTVEIDISNADDRQRLTDFCSALENGVDMLINGAGLNKFATLADHTDDDINRILTVNLISQIALSRQLLPLLLQQAEASIVNIGSTLGSIGLPGYTVYSASKFGVRGFSEALGRELMDTNVSVRYFAPRGAKTALNDDRVVAMNEELGSKMDTPEQVANAFVDFLLKEARRAYLGWPEKLFVRINGLLPGLVDKSILKQLPIFKRYL